MKRIYTKLKTGLIISAIALVVSSMANAQVNDTITFDTDPSPKSASALGDGVFGNYTWSMLQAFQNLNPDVRDMMFGYNSLRMRRQSTEYGYMEMKTDKPYGLGSISFYAARADFSGDRTGNSPTFVAEYSTDGGVNWVAAGPDINLNGVDALTKYTYPNINISGNVRIRLRVTGGDSGKRFNIDSLVFTGYGTAAVCNSVTALTLTDNEDGSINASWTAPATAPANGYAYAVVPTGTTPVAADYTNTTAVSLTNLTATTTSPAITFVDGNAYDVYVIAKCSATESSSAVSATVTVTIDNTPSTCPDVTNLAALDNADGTISISWTAVVPTPAEGYGYAVVPAGTTVALADFVHTTTGTSVMNLTETTEATPATFVKGSTYDVVVIAMCSLTPQSISNQVKKSVTVTNIGVKENEIALTVYPNPAIESVYVNASNVDVANATISVLDLTGKVLSTTNMVSELTEVNVSNLAAGVYFVKVQSGLNMNIVKVVKK